ncbi:hypothetical protein GCM10009527_083380 [Actinomadura nitritigenes]
MILPGWGIGPSLPDHHPTHTIFRTVPLARESDSGDDRVRVRACPALRSLSLTRRGVVNFALPGCAVEWTTR